jgi:hypothetical protein
MSTVGQTKIIGPSLEGKPSAVVVQIRLDCSMSSRIIALLRSFASFVRLEHSRRPNITLSARRLNAEQWEIPGFPADTRPKKLLTMRWFLARQERRLIRRQHSSLDLPCRTPSIHKSYGRYEPSSLFFTPSSSALARINLTESITTPSNNHENIHFPYLPPGHYQPRLRHSHFSP